LFLFDELKKDMIKAVGQGYGDIVSIGVDTWGVDFRFVGKNNVILGYPYVYRDSRTDGVIEYASQFISKEELYSYSGIMIRNWEVVECRYAGGEVSILESLCLCS